MTMPPIKYKKVRPTPIKKMYDDANALAIEVHNYVITNESKRYKELQAGAVDVSPYYIIISERLIRAITFIAGLVDLESGKVTKLSFRNNPAFRLGGSLHDCKNFNYPTTLPDALKSLLERTASLYRRCMRLDDLTIGLGQPTQQETTPPEGSMYKGLTVDTMTVDDPIYRSWPETLGIIEDDNDQT
jgi:hypothetical protein